MGRKSSQKKKKKEYGALAKDTVSSSQTEARKGIAGVNRKWYLLLAVTLIVSVLSYANSLQNEFVFDDSLVIVENPGIRGVKKVPRLLGLETGRVAYRPMRMVSYALDYTLNQRLWHYFGGYKGFEKGLNPLGYHISNILFHIVASLLVFLIVFRLAGDGRVAFLASSLFALHPVHTDSVTYLSGRRDILCGLFYLAGFYCFLRYRQSRKFALIIATFIFYLLSLGSKEMGVTLPVLFLCYDLIQNFSIKRETIDKAYFKELFAASKKSITQSRYLYSFLFIGAMAFSYYKVFVKSPSLQATFYGDSLLANFLTVGRILVYYMKLLVYPINLNADYSFNSFPLSSSLFEPSSLLAILCLMGVAYLVLRLLGRDKLMAFGIIWFFVTLLPVSHIFPHHELLAEHYLYLPSVGFCLLVALLCNDFLKKGRYVFPLSICFMVVALLFSLRVADRNKDWRNGLTLWKKTVKTSPQCARAQVNLSEAYVDAGRLDEALASSKKALIIKPNHIEGHNNLGTIYARKNMLDEAIAKYERALTLRPRYAKAHLNLGLCYFRKGETDKAISEYKQALAIKRGYYSEAHNNLGVAYRNKGKISDAIASYQSALRINPSYAEAYYNLGVAYAKQKKWDKAIDEYKKALAVNSQYTNAQNNLAIAYMKKGELDKAISGFQRILTIDAEDVEANFNLGIAYAKKGELTKSVDSYKQALVSGLDTPELHANLGNIYFQQGRLDEAIQEYKQALAIKNDFAVAHNNLGITYLKKGEYALAIKHCDMAVDLGGAHPKLQKDLLPYR